MLIPTSNHQDAIKIPGGFLLNLMQRGKLRMTWKVEPEQRMSIEFADFMRQQTLEGHYKGIWFHIANEGKRSRIVAMILKAMGMIPGAPDFVFLWRCGTGAIKAAFIELKTPGNGQSDNQKDFQAWAEYWMIPYAVHTSAESAACQMKEWGAV